jgi:hypothetical protein
LFLPCWQNFAGFAFFGTHSPGFPDAERFLGLSLALLEADDTSFAFALRLTTHLVLLIHDVLNSLKVRLKDTLGSMEGVMFYWFTQVTGTELSTIPARSASLNGTLLFVVPSTAVDKSLTVGR